MAAIMGIDLSAVEVVCADAAQGEVVEIANVNSAQQIVIAGHRTAVERAVKVATERGGKMSVMLPVSAPFHCSLMAPAGTRLAPELESAQVADPRVPVVRNVDAGVTRKADEVRPFLLRQVASPVRWTECVQRLAAEGATTFVEVGPGRVLSGLLRRIITGARGQSIEEPAGLEKVLTTVAGDGGEARA